MLTRPYQICTRCILSTADDASIYFDKNGVCNHCNLYEHQAAIRILPASERTQFLEKLIAEIKEKGKNNAYDCVIGVSGGVDSTYVALLVKQYGLRPLAVHCDNGWNSELAVSNISNTLKELDIDLYTHVINWEEFKNLQLAYLKASVIDIEATSDHAIFATLYKVAYEKGIKYILSGENFRTEGILPERWAHNKNDLINIHAINRRFGNGKLKTFPKLGVIRKFYFEKIKRIQYVKLLDLVHYNRKEAKELLTTKLNWRDYGGKHYESIITRFYQSFILPVKFQVDKRKSHLSTMICSGQLTREEALIESAKPLISESLAASDKEYVLKKFGLSNEAFNTILSMPQVEHTYYPSILNLYRQLRFLSKFIKWFSQPKKQKRRFTVNNRGKKVAMLLDNSYTNDNRVIQEATTVAKYFNLTMFCMYSPDLPFREIKNGVKIERIIPRDVFRFQSQRDLKMVANRIASYQFDVIHCHDHLMLRIGAMIKKLNPNTVLIYDSHELFHSWPLNFTTKNPYIIFKSLYVRMIQIRNEKKFGRAIDFLVTVNQSLADNLKEYFKLKTNPLVIRNVPVNEIITDRNYVLRKKFNIPDEKKILVFIGAHIYLQSLNMVQVLNEIGNKEDLVLIIISSGDEHRKQVENYVKRKKFNNVLFHDVVPHHQITTYLSGCDAGIVPTWNKKDLSYWYALDNKLFNYLMAEIPMLSTAQPEYSAIVEKYKIGVCVNPDVPGAYYKGWKEVIDKQEIFKANLQKAKQELNWTNESKLLIDFYDQLLIRKETDTTMVNFLPTIAMLLDNSFTMDSRVYREAKTLVNHGYSLTLYAVKRHDLPEFEIKDGISIHRIFEPEIFTVKSFTARKKVSVLISRQAFDILHCHDQLMVFIGTLVKKIRPETMLIYDSHELFHSWPINYSSKASPWVKLKSDIVRKIEVAREYRVRHYIDRLITVSSSIGIDLKNYFELKNSAIIIRNLAEYEEITTNDMLLRRELGLSNDVKIVLNFSLYIYWKSRNIEAAIEQFANKPGVALVFICGEGGNKNEIMQWVSEAGYKNIFFHTAIQPADIVKFIQAADYGLLSTWNKQYMSYWLGLENKLFHYVMAELPVLASAQPEHKEIIEKHNIGVCVNADEPDAYYKGFLELEKRKEEFKASVKTAKKILNWEHEQKKLLDLYGTLKDEYFIHDRY